MPRAPLDSKNLFLLKVGRDLVIERQFVIGRREVLSERKAPSELDAAFLLHLTAQRTHAYGRQSRAQAFEVCAGHTISAVASLEGIEVTEKVRVNHRHQSV